MSSQILNNPTSKNITQNSIIININQKIGDLSDISKDIDQGIDQINTLFSDKDKQIQSYQIESESQKNIIENMQLKIDDLNKSQKKVEEVEQELREYYAKDLKTILSSLESQIKASSAESLRLNEIYNRNK
jgi:archaellum component FlaC